MSFFDELIGGIHYVLFSSEPLVNLQQLVHLLLKTRGEKRMRRSRSRKDKKTLESGKTDGVLNPPEGVILLPGKTDSFIHSLVFQQGRKAGIIFLY